MYPGDYVETTPEKPAIIMGASGVTVTFRELDARSTQLARLLRHPVKHSGRGAHWIRGVEIDSRRRPAHGQGLVAGPEGHRFRAGRGGLRKRFEFGACMVESGAGHAHVFIDDRLALPLKL